MLFEPATSLIRIYHFQDTDRGYGDAGTFKYAKISPEDYTEVENKRFDGSTYLTYNLTDEYWEKLKSIGFRGYGMSMTFSTDEEYHSEINAAKEYLKRLEVIG